MSIHEWLQAIYSSQIGTTMREVDSFFAWVESIHVLAVVTLVGTIAVADLRLLGYPAHRRGARELLLELLPFTWGAFVAAVITGSLLFSSNALRYGSNPQFLAKMILLVLAGINMAVFHLTIYRNIADWNERLPPPMAARIAGATSLALWVAVIFVGRWIGFVLYS